MKALAFRLKPHQDLRYELDHFVIDCNIEAACIVTCVGSLSQAVFRLADQSIETQYEGPFEIVSLSGIMSRYGSHYHMAIADSQGQVLGGHVLQGCLIYTTAEIIVGILPQFSFCRELDAVTGYKELAIYPASLLSDTDQ